MIVDLFAGPGGWSEGLRNLSPDAHATEIGLEWDTWACATRKAAGHRTIQTDISRYPTEPFAGKTAGLIASPPCQDFSVAGKQKRMAGERSELMWELPRWVDALKPRWVVCEQVPLAREWFEQFAATFNRWGYSTWCGVLNAADYGVPQTRKRIYLIATQDRTATPPPATHAEHPEPVLFGPQLEPWVTMAEALKWETGQWFDWCWQRPSTTVVGSFRPDIIAGPGHDLTRPRQNREGSVKITEQDALTLQSFPPDYPIQGSKTARFQQIGNAVAPQIATHILRQVGAHE